MKVISNYKRLVNISITILMNFFLSCENEPFVTPEIITDTTNASQSDFVLESNSSNGEVVFITYNQKRIQVEKINDQYLLEGDIIVKADSSSTNNVGAKATGRTTGRWENNRVYYTIDSSLPQQYRVFDAIAHWESKTNIRFLSKTTTTKDYVTFIAGTGCSSALGKIGGQQFIHLGSTCSTGNTIHEIGHAVGLWHEQSRKDRDDYITVHFENIRSDKEHNFKTYTERYGDGDEYTGTLDFSSIMMYPYNAFSNNGHPTITKKDGSIYFAQRDGLSSDDIIGLSKMYPKVESSNTILLPVIKNPSFSENGSYEEGNTKTCSCVSWYNPNFLNVPISSIDSNDDPGNQGGGSIKLINKDGNQKVAYQLLDEVTPGATYTLKFYYAIKNSGTIGALDFRILRPNANTPAEVTPSNTVAQYKGRQTARTNTIKESQGGGQFVALEFTPDSPQVALYAVNSVLNGSDVRIDNFSIEITDKSVLPEIKNPTFSIKDVPVDGASFACSCVSWYHPNFLYNPSSSEDSNDDAGTQGGGSIKLTNTSGAQKVAYQVLDGIIPGKRYILQFYYSIKNSGIKGALDFRVLTPNADRPSEVTYDNTIAQFTGRQTKYTNSIKGSQGGGQMATLEFTADSHQVALYAVNAVLDGSDVRIDNFSIELVQ